MLHRWSHGKVTNSFLPDVAITHTGKYNMSQLDLMDVM